MSTYLYGFNGKEKDNEVSGEWNLYNYGMREYGSRVPVFWSPDPMAKNFPDLSPYQFAGGNPIKNLDLDGGEPKDYTWNLQNKRFNVNGGKLTYVHITDDPKLGYIDVEALYDKTENRTYFVHQGNDGIHYYWKHNPGADQTVRTAGNGKWETYETGEEIAYRQTDKLLRGVSLGFAAAIVAPFAVQGLASATPELLTALFKTRGISVLTDYGTQVVANAITGKGWNSFADFNITSLATSFINPGAKLSTLALNSSVSSAFQYSSVTGWNTVLNGKSGQRVLLETSVSVATGFIGGKIAAKYEAKLDKINSGLDFLKDLGADSRFRTYRVLQFGAKYYQGKVNEINAAGSTTGNAINNAIESNDQK